MVALFTRGIKGRIHDFGLGYGHLDDPAVGSVEVRVPPVGHGPVEEPVHRGNVHVDVLGRLHDVVNVSEIWANEDLFIVFRRYR